MTRWRFRPSKPVAVLGAVFGVGMIIFVLANFHHGTAFVAFWCVGVAAIIGFNLWAAFSPRGSLYEASSDGDSPPGRFGTRSEREPAGRH